MASEKITKFIDDIKTLSVLELSELIDAIQEEFGVTAVMAAAPAAGAGAAAAEEKTEFDVVLASFGDAKMAVIKAAKDVLGLGLRFSYFFQSKRIPLRQSLRGDFCFFGNHCW